MQTIRTEILKWFFLEKNSEMTTFNFSFVIKNLKIWSVKFKTHLHQSHQFYIKMRYLMLTWTKYSYYHTFPMHQEQRNSLLYAVKLLVFLCIFLIFWYRVDIKYVKRDKDKVQYLRLNTCIPKSTICKVIAQYLRLVKTSHHRPCRHRLQASRPHASCYMREVDTRRLIDVLYGVQSTKFTFVMTGMNWW